MTTDVQAIGLPFEEAASFFRQKTRTPTARWNDIWGEAHSRSFMVAGAASDALLKDFQDAIQKALDQGTTLATFRGEFDAIVKRHGWSHTGSPAWRSRIIYETNLAGAYSAGRYAQMTDPDVLAGYPYWQYEHSGNPHPRLQHLAWDGLTLRADDAFWETHYPPNGWHCGCRVRPVSEAGLGRMGKSGPDRAPPLVTRTWVDKVTGAEHQVPIGIDPGFDYNPGKSWLQAPVKSDPVRPLPLPSDPRHPGVSAPLPAIPASLERFLDDPNGHVVVGALPRPVQKLLGSETADVRLSEASLAKQQHNHEFDLAREDYAVLPELVAHPTVVLKQSDTHIHLLKRSGKLWVATVKTTKDRRENYVVSFRRTNVTDIERLVRAAALGYGDLGDLQ